MAVFADGKIEAYVGPPALGAADDLEAVIIDFIAGARSKLSIAVQELDSEPIARAILAASWRGVHVELFLEQDYLRTSLKRENGIPIKPVPVPGETPEQALERCSGGRTRPTCVRIAVCCPRCFGRMCRRAVTSTPTFSTRSSSCVTTSTARPPTPAIQPCSQARPTSRGRTRTSAIFTFSGSSGIDDTMVALARGGMKIRGVLDPGQANQDWAAPKTMKPPIELFVPKKTGGVPEPAHAPSQADGDRRARRRRGLVHLHAAGERVQRREPPSSSEASFPRSKTSPSTRPAARRSRST